MARCRCRVRGGGRGTGSKAVVETGMCSVCSASFLDFMTSTSPTRHARRALRDRLRPQLPFDCCPLPPVLPLQHTHHSRHLTASAVLTREYKSSDRAIIRVIPPPPLFCLSHRLPHRSEPSRWPPIFVPHTPRQRPLPPHDHRITHPQGTRPQTRPSLRWRRPTLRTHAAQPRPAMCC